VGGNPAYTHLSHYLHDPIELVGDCFHIRPITMNCYLGFTVRDTGVEVRKVSRWTNFLRCTRRRSQGMKKSLGYAPSSARRGWTKRRIHCTRSIKIQLKEKG
jgi:hypothetical protein